MAQIVKYAFECGGLEICEDSKNGPYGPHSLQKELSVQKRNQSQVQKIAIKGKGFGLVAKQNLPKGTWIAATWARWCNDARELVLGDLDFSIDVELYKSQLQARIQTYERESPPLCNVQRSLLRDSEGRYYCTSRTSRDVKAGEELCAHYTANQWLIMKMSYDSTSKEDDYLQKLVISRMGKSLKEAVFMVLGFSCQLREKKLIKF